MKEDGWEDEPYAFIHPWTSPTVMTGHASLGLEILEDLEDVDFVYVPMGGRGLLARVGSAIRAVRPDVRVVAVEPEGCPVLRDRDGQRLSEDLAQLGKGFALDIPFGNPPLGLVVPEKSGDRRQETEWRWRLRRSILHLV